LEPRVQIGHAWVHAGRFSQMVEAIVAHTKSAKSPQYIVTPNAQHIVLLARDKYLQKIYSEARFVLPDGISLIWAARLLGQPIPHRVTGVDMFEALCARAAQEGLRVFLLGGRPGSAEKAASNLQLRYSGLQIAGTSCPALGFEDDVSQRRAVESEILRANPHLLFVALGAPKQEYWMHEHARRLGVPITMGVGGAFEMIGGIVRRAPVFVQKLDCEWLYRLAKEPRRMWKRYLIGNLQFASIVLNQRRTRRLQIADNGTW